MARTDSRNIFLNDKDKSKLAEIYQGVIEAVQKAAISEQIKNKNYSGDATTGSVEISRFKNATVNDLGTARTAGKGDALKDSGKVVVNVDTDKEIVEEIATKDIKLYGVAGIADKRKDNHTKRMAAYLDNEFFAKAEAEGKEFTPTKTKLVDKLEELILAVETTKNDWVDGVDRDMLVLTVTPAVYSELSNFINEVPNSIKGFDEKLFNRVRIFSNHRQTHPAICMIEGAVAQLVTTDQYDAEKIPLSNDVALELFFSKGTKAVMPDLIQFIK